MQTSDMATVLEHVTADEIPLGWARKLRDPLRGRFRVTIEVEEEAAAARPLVGLQAAVAQASGLWADRSDIDETMQDIRADIQTGIDQLNAEQGVTLDDSALEALIQRRKTRLPA